MTDDLRIINSSIALSRIEIARLVNQYIGVSDGYLGNFSYRTHTDFYGEYCNLDINPDEYEGTTRERFIMILSSLPPRDQAAVVRGVIDKFPVGEKPVTRTAEVRNEFLKIIQRLEAGTFVPSKVALPHEKSLYLRFWKAISSISVISVSVYPVRPDRCRASLVQKE